MKSSYILALERQQRRLNLSHKQLNKYDIKYNNINLIKYLMSLEKISESNTGFYGAFEITNEKSPGSQNIDIYARLYFNGNPLTNEITISHPQTESLNVSIGDRLPNPSSILVLRLRFEAGITGLNSEDYTGFTPGNATSNPLTENNYIDLVVDSGEINNGTLTLKLITFTPD